MKMLLLCYSYVTFFMHNKASLISLAGILGNHFVRGSRMDAITVSRGKSSQSSLRHLSKSSITTWSWGLPSIGSIMISDKNWVRKEEWSIHKSLILLFDFSKAHNWSKIRDWVMYFSPSKRVIASAVGLNNSTIYPRKVHAGSVGTPQDGTYS